MKFGPVPVGEARRRHRGAFDPPGRPGAQEGHRDRRGRDRGAASRPASPRSWWRGSSRATCRRTRPRPRSRPRSRARACASTAPSPAAPICSPRRAGVLVVDKDAIDRLNLIDESITLRDAAGLQAGGRRRDDRDRQDHPLRGRRRRCATRRWRSRARRRRCPRRALSHPQGRRGLDHAAGPRRQGDRQDAAGHRRAAGAGRRRHRRRAARAARAGARSPRRSRRCSREGAELVIVFGASAIADRRDVIPAAIEAVGGRDRAFRHAGRSRQSAAARPTRAAVRCSARRAARARPKENGFDWVLMRLLAGLAGAARRHHRHGRRRPADGDRHAAAAARRAGRGRRGTPHRRRRARRRPLDPHGRAEQAARRDRRQAAGAHRGRAGAGVARRAR